MIDNQTVGKTIAALRQQADLSQQALADLCSVTHQAVSKWEKGLALPDMQTMLFLSKYFSVPMEDILTGNLPVSADAEKAPEQDAEIQDEILSEAAMDITADMEAENEVDPAVWDDDAEEIPGEKEEIPAMPWQEICHLVPFASAATLDQLVYDNLEKGETADWKIVSHLLPFVSQSTVDELLDHCPDRLWDWKRARSALPFASREKIEQMFSQFLKEMDVQKLTEIAPFVSRDFLAQAIREMGDTVDADLVIRRLLPFLPREMVDELIQRKMGKKPQTAMDLAQETLQEARKTLERAGQDRETMAQEDTKKGPRKERALMRIARKAVEEGNEEWLEEHGEDLTADELDEIIPMAADKGLWDALEEIWEHADNETLQKLIRKAVEQEQWDLLEEMQEHADAETMQYITRAASSAHQWELLEELQEHLDDPSLRAAARAAAQNKQWDLLEEMLDRLDQDTLQEMLEAALQDANWEIIDAISELMDE